MADLRKLAGITICATILATTFYPLAIHAQLPSTPQPGMNDNNIDDLPGDSNQLKSWRCTNADRAVEVEVKDVTLWQETVEEEGWQCQESISTIPANDRQFSCEPDETIGILTVTWLEGKGGRQQMQNWIDQLAQSRGMICTLRETTPYWE